MHALLCSQDEIFACANFLFFFFLKKKKNQRKDTKIKKTKKKEQKKKNALPLSFAKQNQEGILALQNLWGAMPKQKKSQRKDTNFILRSKCCYLI